MQLRKDGTMRKLLFAAALALVMVAPAVSQTTVNYVPTLAAVFVSSDGTGHSGTFQPLTGSGGSTINYVPQPMGMMYSTDGTGNAGTWAFCSATTCGGGGGGSNPVGGLYAIQYYATSSTLRGSANATVDASGNGYFAGELTLGAAGTPAQVRPTATIVANLPAASTLAPVVSGSTIQYTMKYVHDESSCGPPVVGGGTTLLWVYSDGTNWICSINPGTGTITGVTAGTGLSGGGTGGTVSVSLAPALPSGETATSQAATDTSTAVATDAMVAAFQPTEFYQYLALGTSFSANYGPTNYAQYGWTSRFRSHVDTPNYNDLGVGGSFANDAALIAYQNYLPDGDLPSLVTIDGGPNEAGHDVALGCNSTGTTATWCTQDYVAQHSFIAAYVLVDVTHRIVASAATQVGTTAADTSIVNYAPSSTTSAPTSIGTYEKYTSPGTPMNCSTSGCGWTFSIPSGSTATQWGYSYEVVNGSTATFQIAIDSPTAYVTDPISGTTTFAAGPAGCPSACHPLSSVNGNTEGLFRAQFTTTAGAHTVYVTEVSGSIIGFSLDWLVPSTFPPSGDVEFVGPNANYGSPAIAAVYEYWLQQVYNQFATAFPANVVYASQLTGTPGVNALASVGGDLATSSNTYTVATAVAGHPSDLGAFHLSQTVENAQHAAGVYWTRPGAGAWAIAPSFAGPFKVATPISNTSSAVSSRAATWSLLTLGACGGVDALRTSAAYGFGWCKDGLSSTTQPWYNQNEAVIQGTGGWAVFQSLTGVNAYLNTSATTVAGVNFITGQIKSKGNSVKLTTATTITATSPTTTGLVSPTVQVNDTVVIKCLIPWEQATGTDTAQFFLGFSSTPTAINVTAVNNGVTNTYTQFGASGATTAITGTLTPTGTSTPQVLQVDLMLQTATSGSGAITIYGQTVSGGSLVIEPGAYCQTQI